MEVIDYFDSDRKEYWLEKIRETDWDAGRFLYRLISEEKISETLGSDPKVFLLTDGDELISFCTYTKMDDIQPCDLKPWIGFVYTFPAYRGHRYMGYLFKKISERAITEGINQIYVSTDQKGLYEKYGFEYLTRMKDIHGSWSNIYVKRIGN